MIDKTSMLIYVINNKLMHCWKNIFLLYIATQEEKKIPKRPKS